MKLGKLLEVAIKEVRCFESILFVENNFENVRANQLGLNLFPCTFPKFFLSKNKVSSKSQNSLIAPSRNYTRTTTRCMSWQV